MHSVLSCRTVWEPSLAAEKAQNVFTQNQNQPALPPHAVGADPASSGTVDGTRTTVPDHGGQGEV